MKHDACLGRMDASGRPDEKACPDILFKLCHLVAHHGLGDAEPLRRTGERSGVNDRGEIGQSIEIHGSIKARRLIVKS